MQIKLTWQCHIGANIHEIGCPHREWRRDAEFKKYWSEKMRIQKLIEEYKSRAMKPKPNKQKFG